MSAIEQELREASSFKPKAKYPDRNEYLSDLALAVDKVSDVDFKKLSEAARNWINSAIDAISEKDDLPDFDDAETGEDPPEDIETELTGDDPDDPEAEDAGVEIPAAKAKVASKAVNGPAAGTSKFRKNKQPKVPMQGKASAKQGGPHQYHHAEKDKFGLVVGSKVSKACEMFEAGCPMSHVIKSLGGPQNNVLHKLSGEGHLIERYEGVIRLTHKDEVKNKPAAKAKAVPEKAPAAKPKTAAKAKG